MRFGPRIRRARLRGSRFWVPATLALGLAAVGFAFWGFLITEPWTEAGYDTIRLFTPGGTDLEDGPWQLQVAVILAPLTAVVLAVEAVVVVFGDEIERARIDRSRRHVIVCGLGRRGIQLADSLAGRGHRVVAIERDPACPGIADARAAGALVMTGDATSPSVLARARVGKARTLLAVCPTDEENAQIAAAVSSRPAGRTPIAVVAVIEDVELLRSLNEGAVLSAREDRPAVEFISLSERAARATLRRHPFLDGSGDEARPRPITIVGCGRRGAALLVAVGRLWHQLRPEDSRRLRVSVVDPDATDRIAALIARYPRLTDDCDLLPRDVAIGTAAFERADFLDHDATGHSIYVCLEDEATSLGAGLAVARRLGPRAVVVIQVASMRNSAGRFLTPTDSPRLGVSGLAILGINEETLTPELLMDPTTETLARALHEEYLRREGAAGPQSLPWENLPEWARDENRAQARDVGFKLRAIGRRVTTLDDWDLVAPVFDEDEVEVVARIEHERWKRRHKETGWKLGPRDDDARRHPDLVPWADLPEHRREIDRVFARALPELLARAGFRVEAPKDAS